MKIVAGLLLAVITSSSCIAQGDCTEEVVMNVKGSWKKIGDANMRPDKNISQVHNRIDYISKLFQSAYPDPKGAEPGWYRTMSRPVLNNGPLAYNFSSLYKLWFCSYDQHKLLLGDETYTWAWVFINNFSWLMSDQYDKVPITVNGLNVYRLPNKKGSVQGYPLYETTAHDVRGCVLITRLNEVPWKPISQQQYLQAIRAKWVESINTTQKSFYKMDSIHQRSIAGIQKSTFMKESDKQNVIADLQKNHEKMLKRRYDDSTKQVSYWSNKIAVIDKYLSQTDAATLKQPAITKESGDFTGQFTTEDKGGKLHVTVNASYFNKQLPSYVPQMMVVYWTFDKSAPSQDFKKHLENDFPFEKLQAMIDH